MLFDNDTNFYKDDVPGVDKSSSAAFGASGPPPKDSVSTAGLLEQGFWSKQFVTAKAFASLVCIYP